MCETLAVNTASSVFTFLHDVILKGKAGMFGFVLKVLASFELFYYIFDDKFEVA